MATLVAHGKIDTSSLPELVIPNGGDHGAFFFSGPMDDTPDEVEFFGSPNPIHVVFHGDLSDLVIAAAQPATMTITSLEVTKDGSALYEISETSFQLLDLYNDAADNSFLDTIPSLAFSGDDTFKGSKKGDLLFGFDGSDLIKGGKGRDIIDGGAGANTLSGGKGGDFFLFQLVEPSNLADHIKDFKPGTDLLGLNVIIFDVLEFKNTVLKSGMFRIGNEAKDGNDHVIYNEQSGALFFDEDGNGVTPKVKIAVLDNHPQLSNDDIFNGLLFF